MSTKPRYDDLLGLPFPDGECYGLCSLIMERAGIHIPDYMTMARDRALSNAGAISQYRDSWQRVTEPKSLDWAVMWWDNPRLRNHLGIVVRPGLLLHALRDRGVCLARIEDPRIAPKIVEYRRWIG